MRSRILGILLIAVVAFGGLRLGGGTVQAAEPQRVGRALVSLTHLLVPNLGRASEVQTERLLENTVVPARDLLDLAERLKRAPQDAPRVAATNAEVLPLSVGHKHIFWVNDQAQQRYFQVPATLRYVTPHLYMWVENGCSVPEDDLKRSADRFENQIYPAVHRYFGSEWDPGVDGDDHISVFNGHVPGVGGYYSSADEYSQAVNGYSNERELFYINLDNAPAGSDRYDGILAHEFQHMVHWAKNPNEFTWVNEGMSELSAELCGFTNNYSSVGAFLARPDTQLTGWADNPDTAAYNYGAAHSFMSYLLKRFGADLLPAMVADKSHGMRSLDNALRLQKRGLTSTDVFADWVVANYLGDPKASPDGRYGIRLFPMPSPVEASFDKYPTRVSSTVHQYGAKYYELRGVGDVAVNFEGTTDVKLVPNDPHSGRYEWWSNRGEDGDMTLTREFDLTNVRSASLNFWTWYDIEQGWDFAYVSASTDGGRTWDTLHGRYNTNASAGGNCLGWAYTGVSGDGPEPAWVQEHLDLTPFAGKKTQVRFEYVTDDAVDHPGLTVDDISVPEIGYVDNAETDRGGWEAKGFVRSANLVPQQYIVQVIEYGKQNTVRRFDFAPVAQLAGDVAGPIVVRGLGTALERAVLVVSAVAPLTGEVAPYQIDITPVPPASAHVLQ